MVGFWRRKLIEGLRRNLSTYGRLKDGKGQILQILSPKYPSTNKLINQKRRMVFRVSNPPPPQVVGYYIVFPAIPDETVENNAFLRNIAANEDWPALNSASPKETMRILMQCGLNVMENFWELLAVGRQRHRQPQKAPKRIKRAPDSQGTFKSESSTSSADDVGKESSEEDERNQLIRRILIGVVVASVLVLMLSLATPNMATQITWSEFLDRVLPTGHVKKVVIWPVNGVAYVFVDPGTHDRNGFLLNGVYQINIGDAQKFEADFRAAEEAMRIPPDNWAHLEYRGTGNSSIFVQLLVLGIFLLPFIYFARKMKSFKMTDFMSNFTKTKINVFDPQAKDGRLKIKFKDVAGLHEAKLEINEFVDYLKNPAKFTRLGAKLPKGALMTGPPGCGKTLLAKALAAEASCPFISMNGTEFIEMIGGLGASRIRSLFKEAKSRAPCIIYIDEIDAIGRKRAESMMGGGGSGEEEQTLNQLLVEMDGMDTTQGVVVIGSTNRPDILDKALLRPGRFDRHVTVDMPTLAERHELFDLYLKKIKKENTLSNYSYRLAQMTPGMSGADIANVINEAAIWAATLQRKYVILDDVDHALQKILAGPEKRSRVLVEEERQIVAYHESGHALVGWLLEHTDALLKVTIVPRTNAALGFAQYSPKDRKLFAKEELFDRMCMMLGGRAAESVVFNRITTGAQNDLEKVTKQAYAQVKIYGMSDVVGTLSFAPTSGDERASQFMKKPYSQKLQKLMDEEVNRLVGKAYFATEKLLKDNRDKLETLSKELLKREVLSYEEVKALIGPPTYGEKHAVQLTDDVLPDVNGGGRNGGSNGNGGPSNGAK